MTQANVKKSETTNTAALTLTITLTPKNTSNVAELVFWTGMSAEDAMNRAFEEFMGGADDYSYGNDIINEVIDSPVKRRAAYKRNGLTPKQIERKEAMLKKWKEYQAREDAAA